MSTRFWYYDDRIDPDSDEAFSPAEMDVIVGLIRESSFLDDQSGLSIEERMTELFGGREPSWVGFQIADGSCYVNCFGTSVGDDGTLTRLELQFALDDELESFELSGLLVNGEEQPEDVIIDFETRMAEAEQD